MSAKRQIADHRFEAGLFPVNAYLVETSKSIVVVDATLGVSDGQALRSRVEALQKPLAAVIVTRHGRPGAIGGKLVALGDDVMIGLAVRTTRRRRRGRKQPKTTSLTTV